MDIQAAEDDIVIPITRALAASGLQTNPTADNRFPVTRSSS